MGLNLYSFKDLLVHQWVSKFLGFFFRYSWTNLLLLSLTCWYARKCYKCTRHLALIIICKKNMSVPYEIFPFVQYKISHMQAAKSGSKPGEWSHRRRAPCQARSAREHTRKKLSGAKRLRTRKKLSDAKRLRTRKKLSGAKRLRTRKKFSGA